MPFFVQHAERGVSIDREEWYSACRSYTAAGVFDALMRCLLDIREGDQTLWGDKSPSYIRHLPLLAQQFPAARIIHIVRDPRDCALSAHKAWGKNHLRTAQRWHDDMSKCRADGESIPRAYIEIKYEDLLINTKETLARLSAFLGIGLKDDWTHIRSTNVGKYRLGMSALAVREIEEISCATLRALEYPCSYTGSPVTVPGWKLRGLQLLDGYRLVRSAVKRRGWLGAVRFQSAYFKISGNRFR